jgi:sugar phosphate isomerase/epimerase
MLREIKTELGFDLIELGHGIRLSLMPGIQKMFDSNQVRFSSLHNFCPLPVEVMMASPDCYQFSAVPVEERERAVRQTFQTIDFAERLGAPFVVVHLGEVKMRPITEPLIRMTKEGKHFSRKYVRVKLKAVETRERRAPAYLPRVTDCLRRIIEHAEAKNVRIALESRRGYEEIPSERELPALLDELNSGQVGYWHDFGHSQIKENLGFIDHAEWLGAVGSRAFGCHVQDCIWPAKDHEPPFAGSIDFEKLVPLLPTNCLFVWEMSANKTADAIRQSVRIWKKRFGE